MTSEFYRYGATILVLSATVAAAGMIDVRSAEALVKPLDSIATGIDGWKGEADPPIRPDVLEAMAATSYLDRTYRRDTDNLNLFIAYYANQRAGESMHTPRNCLPGAGWEILHQGATDLDVWGRKIQVNRFTIQKDLTRMAVLYWYQSRRRIIANEYLAKILLVRDAVTERRTGGALVRIICDEDPRTVKAATAFAEAVVPQMQFCMTGLRGPQN